jgi:beta-xylosidase
VAENVFAADTYTNPIIDADYSDPDVIRVGDDFYLTASSFNSIPGLPILCTPEILLTGRSSVTHYNARYLKT